MIVGESNKSTSLKKIDEQLDSITQKCLKYSSNEEKKHEMEKESEILAKKLQEEDKKEAENRRIIKEEKNRAKCKICYDLIDYQESYYMDSCEDIFHDECIKNFVHTNFENGKIPIKCPKCDSEILYSDLRNLLTDLDLQKYDTLAFKNHLDKNPDGYSFCPTPNCPYVFFWENDFSNDFSCPVCKKRYCLECKCEFHIGKTCKQHRKAQNKVLDEEFKNFAFGQKYKQCPNCHWWVEKISVFLKNISKNIG